MGRPRAIFRAIALSSSSASSYWRAAAAEGHGHIQRTHAGARTIHSVASSRWNGDGGYWRSAQPPTPLLRSALGCLGGTADPSNRDVRGSTPGAGAQLQQRRGYARGGGGGGAKSEEGIPQAAGPAHKINDKITARQIRLVLVTEGGDGDGKGCTHSRVVEDVLGVVNWMCF